MIYRKKFTVLVSARKKCSLLCYGKLGLHLVFQIQVKIKIRCCECKVTLSPCIYSNVRNLLFTGLIDLTALKARHYTVYVYIACVTESVGCGSGINS